MFCLASTALAGRRKRSKAAPKDEESKQKAGSPDYISHYDMDINFLLGNRNPYTHAVGSEGVPPDAAQSLAKPSCRSGAANALLIALDVPEIRKSTMQQLIGEVESLIEDIREDSSEEITPGSSTDSHVSTTTGGSSRDFHVSQSLVSAASVSSRDSHVPQSPVLRPTVLQTAVSDSVSESVSGHVCLNGMASDRIPATCPRPRSIILAKTTPADKKLEGQPPTLDHKSCAASEGSGKIASEVSAEKAGKTRQSNARRKPRLRQERREDIAGAMRVEDTQKATLFHVEPHEEFKKAQEDSKSQESCGLETGEALLQEQGTACDGGSNDSELVLTERATNTKNPKKIRKKKSSSTTVNESFISLVALEACDVEAAAEPPEAIGTAIDQEAANKEGETVAGKKSRKGRRKQASNKIQKEGEKEDKTGGGPLERRGASAAIDRALKNVADDIVSWHSGLREENAQSNSYPILPKAQRPRSSPARPARPSTPTTPSAPKTPSSPKMLKLPKDRPSSTGSLPGRTARASSSANALKRAASCHHLPPASPASPSQPPQSAPIQRKLRVAIFNACQRLRNPHPAALGCMTALMQTPWFHSQAVARLLNSVPLRFGRRRAPLSYVPPVEAHLLHADEMGRLVRPNGHLAQGFDVLIVPGGSTKRDLRALGKEGIEQIREFVKTGGGYCGICAGAFLASEHLKFVETCPRREVQATEAVDTADGAAMDSDDDGRVSCSDDEGGEGEEAETPKKSKKSAAKRRRDPYTVKAHFSKLGRRLLWSEGKRRGAEDDEGPDGSIDMRYHNGPLMEVPKGSTSRALCHMWPAENAADVAPPALSGAAAFVMQDFGGGRVVVISPHPESTQESGFAPEPGKVRLRRILQRAVLLAASGPEAHSWIESTCHLLA